jgi:hypothetical protein
VASYWVVLSTARTYHIAVVRKKLPPAAIFCDLAGWINQQQREAIDYLQTENPVLREQLGPRRLRFTDDQRIRLAAKAKHLRGCSRRSEPS